MSKRQQAEVLALTIPGCVDYLARVYGIKTTTDYINAQIHDGLPAQRISRTYYILKADVDVWLQRRARQK